MADNVTDKKAENQSAAAKDVAPTTTIRSSAQIQPAPKRRFSQQRTKTSTNPFDDDKQFEERVMNIDRVARVVKGGRRFRFRALVVVGDKKGMVGVGSAKGADVTSAIAKASDVAKKDMMKIKLYKDTLPHEAQAKVGGANILIMPASSGTGLIAGGVVRTVLEVGGVKNALSKSLGSTNKTNIAYATLKALGQLETANNWVIKKSNKTDASKGAK